MNTQSEYMSNKSGHTDTLGEPCLKTFCINQACFNVTGFATVKGVYWFLDDFLIGTHVLLYSYRWVAAISGSLPLGDKLAYYTLYFT